MIALRETARADRQVPVAAPSAAGGLSRLAYQRAVEAKLNVPALLKSAKLTERHVTDEHVRIPVTNQIRFLNVVADALQNDFLGIELGQSIDLRAVGLLYYVMASSSNLDDALRRVAR